MIVNGTLPTRINNQQIQTTVCANSPISNSNNPTCYQICRLFDSSSALTSQFVSVTDPIIGPLLDKLISIRWVNNGEVTDFLTLRHIPCSKTINEPLGFCGESNSIDNLLNVPLMAIPSDYSATGCESSQIEFDTSLLMMIGARSYDDIKRTNEESGIVNGQLLSLAAVSYIGWLSTDLDNNNSSSNIIWRQAYDIYQGFGISSIDPRASNYNIQVTHPFDRTPPSNFPTGTLGTIGLSILTSNDESITIQSIDGSTLTLDDVEAVVYDPNTLAYQSRRTAISGCNLLLN